MEYFVLGISVALGAFIGVISALLLFRRVEKHIEEGKSLINDLMQNTQEKTELLYPMDEDEEQRFEYENTDEGVLNKLLESKMPWGSKQTIKNQSLGSSKKTNL